MLDELKNLNKIFNINQSARNKIWFNSTFQSSEKKRLELKKVAEKTLHSRIWNEYVDVFTKHKNSLNDLNNWLTEQEHSKKPYILATRHIRNIYRELKNICKFIDWIIVYEILEQKQNKT